MTKKDLITEYRNQNDCTYIDAEKAVESVIDIIKTTLEEGEEVIIRNFGTFKIKHCNARMGRNPATGEAVSIPEKSKVVFKSSITL